MEGSRKALKVISIVLIVYAAFLIVFGMFMAFGGMLPGLSDATLDVNGSQQGFAAVALAVGGILVVTGIIDLIIGLLGLRGAKNPKKIGIFFVLSLIGVVLGAIGLVSDIMQGTLQPASIASLLLVAVCAGLAYTIKKQNA